jgi:isoleucyl-tRNA synthetase
MYPKTAPSPDFVELEKEILSFWRDEDIFAQSVENRPQEKNGNNNAYVFYDGPPFANGLPHYGHLLTGFVKDIFARYHTMLGRRVERRFGWDCHGLPAEMGAEKELGISGRASITEFGVEKFNAHCRTSVMKYAHEWERYVERQARWVDFENDYKTMDKNYMESVLWAFKQLYDKGLIYEAYRVMPYSWAAETPLSNFETRLDNSYRQKESKAVTVAFTLSEVPDFIRDKNFAQNELPNFQKYKLVAWTTTPWTLPSNLALAVSSKVAYQLIGLRDICYIVSTSAAEKIKNYLGEEAVIYPQEYSGNYFLGLTYEPLFPYFKNHPNSFRVLDGSDFITTEDGTGIVHMAPGFGEDDQRVCEANNIKLVCPVDSAGKFTDEVADLNSKNSAAEFLLETERAYLRPFSADDLEVFYQLQSDPDVRKHFPNVLSLKEAKSMLNEFLEHQEKHGFSCFAAFEKSSGKFMGFAGCNYCGESSEIEICYSLHQEFWGKGFATELSIACMLDLFRNFAVEKILGFATPGNDSSFSILKKLGMNFVKEGIHWHDHDHVHEYEISKEAFLSTSVNEISARRAKAENLPLLTGRQVFETNDDIIKFLKLQGSWLKTEQYLHNYPHCWRTDTPLIYKALPSWYVEVTKFKDRMVELNQNINWIPENIRDGQFGKWLENARDWSISRNRFWGTPIPVWRSDNPENKKLYVFGSIAELEEFFATKITDLHRPFIDELIKPDPLDPKYTLRRVEDVFDCWFESGSMPFAQVHYPFENKQSFEENFPADFIVEYVAQTRGWFYTLVVLATALFDKHPFKNCICHGVVLDEKGQKLSKRLNNYADPMDVFARFGADAMRFVMISAPIMHGGELLIDKEGAMIRDAVRLVMKPVWNAYHFLTLYANADGLRGNFCLRSSTDNVLDNYILTKCRQAVEEIKNAMDSYSTPLACRAVESFFEVLNNWYIRRSKDRFWKKEKDADKQAAYDTLHTVLVTMTRAMAPLLPLLSEVVYRGLVSSISPSPQPSPAIEDFSSPASGGGQGGGITSTTDDKVPQKYIGLEIFTHRNSKALSNAKELRKNMTDAEIKLWSIIKERKINGVEFRRQQAIGPYIADFCSLSHALVIEVDGSQHAENKIYDSQRTEFIQKAGFRVIRFWNNEVLENIEGVWEKINENLKDLQKFPLPTLPRRRGRSYSNGEGVSPASAGFSFSSPASGGQGDEAIPSVHLSIFPDVSAFPNDIALINAMDLVRDVCNTALSIRNAQNIRVRQPLASLTLAGAKADEIQAFQSIIQEEVNVKSVKFIADFSVFAEQKLSIQFPVLGKRLPDKMKQIIPAAKKGEWKISANGGVEIIGEILQPEEFNLLLEAKPEFKKSAQALSQNDSLVLLDLEISADLKDEGIARDTIRLIQEARKNAGFDISDHIELALISTEKNLNAALEKFQHEIASQTLTRAKINFSQIDDAVFSVTEKIDDAEITIQLRLAA